jgi:hypothetical protein
LAVDIQKILAELHEERRQVNEVIVSLERLSQGLQGRKNVPTAARLLALDGGKRTRTASPKARANGKAEQTGKAKSAGI